MTRILLVALALTLVTATWITAQNTPNQVIKDGNHLTNSVVDWAVAERIERENTWHGIKLSASQESPFLQHVATALELEPVPDERQKIFDRFLAKSSPFKCIGWKGQVLSSVENNIGWQIRISVAPYLVEPGVDRHVLIDQSSEEVWQLSREGRLTLVSADSRGRGYTFLY